MKIFHSVLTDGFYGSEMACAQLALFQIEANQALGYEHSIRVMVRGRNADAKEKFLKILGKESVVILPRWWPSCLEGWAAKKVMQGFLPDIVHLHLGQASRSVGKVANKLKIPCVATLHLRYKPRNEKHMDGLIAVAEWQVEAARSRGFKKPITTIWNTIKPSSIFKIDEIKALREEWGVKSHHKVIVSVGRLVLQKGFYELIESFKEIENNNARLVIIGDGVERENLESLAKQDSRIILLGYRSDVLKCLAASDGFISASRVEAFGLNLLEALNANLPIACTKTDGPKEFLNNFPIIWADINNIKSIKSALEELLQRPKSQYDLSDFDHQKMALTTFKFYEDMISNYKI